MKFTKSSFVYDEVIMQGMFYCPFGKENYSCFFQWLQKKSTKEKIAWYNSLTYRDKQDLIYCHLKCSCKSSIKLDKIKYFQNN
jgi:hypothetical protein